MKPKKMSLANIEGQLTRAEMKKVMAGSGQFGCECQGSVGAWTYTDGMPSCYAQYQDVVTYCRSQAAICWGGCYNYA